MFRNFYKSYLLFKHDPMASNAALVQKFSEAINSSPDFCLCFSALIIALISGSSCSKGSVPKKNDLAAPPDNLKDWPANLVKELNLEGNMAADDCVAFFNNSTNQLEKLV